MTVTDSEGFLPNVKIVLFEKSGDGRVKTCAGGFENATNDQKAFTNFLSGLLHFRSDSSAYSLNPRAYPAKPLFADDDKNPTLNDLFWLIFDNMPNCATTGSLSGRPGRRWHWQATRTRTQAGIIVSVFKFSQQVF